MAVLTYYNNIPLGLEKPSVSRPKLQANFGSISQIMAIDHYTFDSTLFGKHAKVTFPMQAVAPPNPDAGELLLYNLFYADTAQGEIHFKRSSGENYPITAKAISGPGAGGRNGWTILPAGLLVNWATSAPQSIAANGTVTFNVLIPKQYPANDAYNVIASVSTIDANGPGTRVTVKWNGAASTATNANFTLSTTTAGDYSVSFIAYGRLL